MSDQPTRLLLIRHAHNDYLDNKRLAGRTPGVHLNEKGQAQAKALAGRLAQSEITAIYSSPMERAIETVEPLALARGLPIRISEELTETDCGEWTGQAIDDLAKTDIWPRIQVYPSGTPHPGGEGISSVQARMVHVLNSICQTHAGQLVAVVSHADPIKAALAYFSGMHLDLFQRLVVDPASVSEVAFSDFGPRVLRINDTAHL